MTQLLNLKYYLNFKTKLYTENGPYKARIKLNENNHKLLGTYNLQFYIKEELIQKDLENVNKVEDGMVTKRIENFFFINRSNEDLFVSLRALETS